MPTPQPPTPGALRAAREWLSIAGPARVQILAEIIDRETGAGALAEALRKTLRALEAHLDESCRDHGIAHRDLLCPCNQNEVEEARAALKAWEEGRR